MLSAVRAHHSWEAQQVHLRPIFSFLEWKIPYWKIVILLLLLPIGQFIPLKFFQTRQRRIDGWTLPAMRLRPPRHAGSLSGIAGHTGFSEVQT